MSDITDKISKLLRQAERAATSEESDVFMAKAQQLASTYSIDLAVARQRTAKLETRRTPTTKYLHLGKRGQKGLYTLVNLAGQICTANDVKYNVAHKSTWILMFGFEEDIEMVERLYESLLYQMTRDFIAWKKSSDYRCATRLNGGLTVRLSYQDGWGDAVGYKLIRARRAAQTAAVQADTAPAGQEKSVALAIRNKELEVSDFYTAKSTARGSYRGGSNARSNHVASGSGYSDGARANIGGNAAIGGSRTAIR